MKLDLGSFAFGSSVLTGGNTPSWGTSLGQKRPDLKLTYPGYDNIVIGMVYKSIPVDKVYIPLGKGGHICNSLEDEGIQLAAMFDKVYINDIKVNAPFIMLIYQDSSESWAGRKSLKYNIKIEYRRGQNDIVYNLDFVKAAREVLQISDEACWVVSDIYISNQDELHLIAGIVNPHNSEMYQSSESRKAAFLTAIKTTYDKHPYLTEKISIDNYKHEYIQRIYYGAPGTGKSNEIKELTSEQGKDGIKFSKNFTFRTTFHPDSDYSTFVGAYKPRWSNEKDKIVYGFRPQTFLKAYVEAWKNPEENVALVIEEINRGNCAQIFGDIFQLLDREASGLSKYPIEADVDMQSYIEAEFKEIDKAFDHEQIALIDNYYEQHYEAAFEKIKNGEILALPMNLSILATMNTSDQSLFPMDSAFKRRWEWVYTPIVNAEKNWKIEIDGYQPIDWWTFLERINKVVAELTISEDKQLGYFFCIPDKKEDDGDIEPTIITADRFVGKVIFYLWNDVFKDYAFDASCCKDNDGKEVLFAQFYGADGKTINTDVLVQFFNNLKDLNGKESPLAIKRQAEIAEEETEAEEENSNEE